MCTKEAENVYFDKNDPLGYGQEMDPYRYDPVDT